MTTLINNPNAAMRQNSFLDGDAADVHEFVTSGAVEKGQAVAATISGGIPVVATATSATAAIVGVALESKGTGKVVKVATGGIAAIQASGTSVAAGTAFSITSGGRVTTVAATLNNKAMGWMLEASGTTAGDLKLAYIQPCLVAAS